MDQVYGHTVLLIKHFRVWNKRWGDMIQQDMKFLRLKKEDRPTDDRKKWRRRLRIHGWPLTRLVGINSSLREMYVLLIGPNNCLFGSVKRTSSAGRRPADQPNRRCLNKHKLYNFSQIFGTCMHTQVFVNNLCLRGWVTNVEKVNFLLYYWSIENAEWIFRSWFIGFLWEDKMHSSS